MAQYSSIPATTTGFGSREINGQLVPVFMGSGFLNVGNAVGPTYYGYGTNTPQTIPLSAGSSASGPLPAMGGSQVSLMTPRNAIILAVMLVVGVAGLRYIHWRA